MDEKRKISQKKWRDKNPNYHAEYLRKWREGRKGYLGPKRQELVDRVTAIKETTPCCDCGNKFPACCMDFDHRGEKTEGVSNMVAATRLWETIAAEIAKCDVVCANCHRIRTRSRGSAGWKDRNHD